MKSYFSNLKNIFNFLSKIDFILFFLSLSLSIIGLSVIYSFSGNNLLFDKQLISLGVSIIVFFVVSSLDIYFLKNSKFIYLVYFLSVGLLLGLLLSGVAISGAQSWFKLGLFAFQPTDLVKFVLVLLLAKYFYKRHIEISRLKHIFISWFYTFVLFILVALQPDLGSAMIIFFIWFGFILISGIPKKYILAFFILGSIISVLLYNCVLLDYQKKRIDTFMNPGADPLGAGYKIIQANISLGSGEVFGKGIMNGSQARLGFLPESETDFIFSAFAEEWGFIGIVVLFSIFSVLILRIVLIAMNGRTNFESLLVAGIAIYFFSNFFVHVGINLGFLPVTGTTMPFMSYGGSHLLIEYFALGIVVAISRTNRNYSKSDTEDISIIG